MSLAVLAVLKAMRGNLLFEYRIMFSTKALRNRAEGPSMHPMLYNQTKSRVNSGAQSGVTGGYMDDWGGLSFTITVLDEVNLN